MFMDVYGCLGKHLVLFEINCFRKQTLIRPVSPPRRQSNCGVLSRKLCLTHHKIAQQKLVNPKYLNRVSRDCSELLLNSTKHWSNSCAQVPQVSSVVLWMSGFAQLGFQTFCLTWRETEDFPGLAMQPKPRQRICILTKNTLASWVTSPTLHPEDGRQHCWQPGQIQKMSFMICILKVL